jgi:hypothetical protein
VTRVRRGIYGLGITADQGEREGEDEGQSRDTHNHKNINPVAGVMGICEIYSSATRW